MNLLGRFVSQFFSALGQLLARPWIIFTAPAQWMLSLSIPARVAVLVAVVLWTGVGAFLVMLLSDPLLVRWQTWILGPRLAVIAALLVIIPLVVYQALRVWLEGKPSPFPDIDKAWHAGLDELANRGISLDRTPLFLVLGSRTLDEEMRLLSAAGIDCQEHCVPRGPAPLHWFITEDAVWLACTDVGCLSVASSLADELRRARPSLKPKNLEAVQTFRATMMAGSMILGDDDAADGGGGVRGTLASPGVSAGRGTMAFDAVESSEEQGPVSMPADKAALQKARLTHFCGLLRRARYPLAPLNGILTLLPYHLLQAGPWGGEVVAQAARSDVPVLIQELGIRCPLVAVVTGLEHQSGFRELIRRIGARAADTQRFGKGSDPWAEASREQMHALANQACGAFEDFIYSFFKKKGSSVDPGNKRLFGLLCQVRQGVEERLGEVLASGYAKGSAEGDALLVTGVYFSACGEEPGTQGFVRGVFDKLVEQQGELEWTDITFRRERRYAAWGQTLLIVNLVLIVTLLGMIYYRWAYQ